MKSAGVWLSFSLFLMLAGYSVAQTPQPKPEKAETKVPDLVTGQPFKEDPKDDELRKLLKARYNEALVEVEGLTRMYQMARASYDSVAEARQRLLQAGLELCEKPADKVALLTQFVESTKESEKLVRAHLEAARGTESAIHRLRYQRLDAEIQLLRAKREADKAKALSKQEEQPRKIVVTSPQAKGIVINQQYVCKILAQRHIDVRALMTGYLTEVRVKEGQAVKKGDVLFKTLPTVYQARLDAELAEVRIAEVEYKNAERLFDQKVVSQQEVALNEAKLAKAKARAKLAEAELDFTTVRAPFDGIIDRLHKGEGSLVKEGDTLTNLSDISSMWVYFNVPEARYLEYMASRDQIKEGSPIELVLANGSKFPQIGKLAAIEAKFNTETGNIAFRADFPNPDRVLRHGQSGTVLHRQALKNAVVIP